MRFAANTLRDLVNYLRPLSLNAGHVVIIAGHVVNVCTIAFGST